MAVFIVALALLSVTAASLYTNSVKLSKDLDSLKERFTKVSKELNATIVKLTQCRLNLTKTLQAKKTLESKLAATTEQLQACKANNTRLYREAEALRAQLAALEANHSRLVMDYQKLTKQLASLQEQYRRLQSDAQKLANRYKSLRTNYTKLLQDYRKLLDSNAKLLERHRSLKQNYTQLLNSYKKLYSGYQALKKAYISLNKTCSNRVAELQKLQQELKTLEEKLAATKKNLDTLKQLITDTNKWLGIYPDKDSEKRFIQLLLRAALQTGEKLAYRVKTRGSVLDTAIEVMKLLEVELVSYAPDPHIRYIDIANGRINVRDQVWSTSETVLASHAGDTEDQALLAYGLLAATLGPRAKVYLVLVYSGGDLENAAVLVDYTLIGNPRHHYLFFDASVNYLNGVKLMLRMQVKANDTTWYVYITPQVIRPSTKKWLIRYHLATIAYRSAFDQRFSTGPRNLIKTYTDPAQALEDWLVKYWRTTSIDRIVIATPTEYHEFKTIGEAAAWLRSHA